MGTTNHGKKQQHNITLSKGGEVAPRIINPDTAKTSRSFAQPSPAAPQETLVPKVHASEDAKEDAVAKNSQLRQEAKVEVKKVPPSPTPKKEEEAAPPKKVEATPPKKTEGRKRTNGALPENDGE